MMTIQIPWRAKITAENLSRIAECERKRRAGDRKITKEERARTQDEWAEKNAEWIVGKKWQEVVDKMKLDGAAVAQKPRIQYAVIARILITRHDPENPDAFPPRAPTT